MNDFFHAQWLVRMGIFVGILFAGTVLTGIYFIKNRPAPEVVDNKRPMDDPPAAALRAIRLNAKQPNAKAEILRWWAPKKNVAMAGGTFEACRVIYEIEPNDRPPERRDGVYAFTTDKVFALQDLLEDAESHRKFDPQFPCKNCDFGIGEPLAKVVEPKPVDIQPKPVDGQPKRVKDDAPKLEGTWAVESVLRDPRAKDPDSEKGGKIIIKGQQVSVIFASGKPAPGKVSYRVDPFMLPKAVDITAEGSKAAVLGIYELKGDTLRLCVSLLPNNNRPAEFASEPGSGNVLIVFQREKRE